MSHSQIDLNKVAGIIGGVAVIDKPDHIAVSYLLTDSRKVVNADASLYFAIKGHHHDGHVFVVELIKDGACNFIISDKNAIPADAKVNFILVNEPLFAMQQHIYLLNLFLMGNNYLHHL